MLFQQIQNVQVHFHKLKTTVVEEELVQDDTSKLRLRPKIELKANWKKELKAPPWSTVTRAQ